MILRFSTVLLLLGAALFGAEKPASDDAELAKIQGEIARYDGLTGFYAREYSKAEPRYWTRIVPWMHQDATTRKVKRILDVGCGYGTLLALSTGIYHAQGYCFDVTDYLKPPFAKARGLAFAKGNIELDPLPWEEKFDVVVFTEVLEHFNFQPQPTLAKIHDAMNPGAVLFLSTPDARDWGRETRYYKHLSDLPMPNRSIPIRDAHIWIYDKHELLSLLEATGFQISQCDYAPGGGNRHFNIRAIALPPANRH
jgi:SAM-dependent methyltransferase